MTADRGWFADWTGDVEAAAERIDGGGPERPADWPTLAVEAGAFEDRAAYYDALKAASTAATAAAVEERERADDRQLVHAVRAMDDVERVTNELGERLVEWATSLGLDRASDAAGEREPVALARALAADAPATEAGPVERRVRSLVDRVADLADERDALRAHVERTAPAVAPNLSAMAGPVLAARLVALAGGLEALAKKPAGTVQVLGAEDALFAHLRGGAPSPKHGVIYTHEYVRGTRPGERGSAARALAGKLAIAARVDHYAGDRRPELDRDLDERIARIRSRGGDGGETDG